MASLSAEWAELNAELDGFFAEAERHDGGCEYWFTPRRLTELRAILDRGALALAQPALARFSDEYLARLRRLLPLLRGFQDHLTAVAARLEAERQRLSSMRGWLQGQS